MRSLVVLLMISFVFIAEAVFSALTESNPYTGSTYSEVLKVITTAPEMTQNSPRAAEIRRDLRLYGTAENPTLPNYGGGLAIVKSVFNGELIAAAKRTIRDSNDYHPYFQKIVHANGVCLAGTWSITENSQYSGGFALGFKSLFIGRVSTASNQNRAGKDRSFGFAGKLFGTEDANEKVKTANFFTVDNLNGTSARNFTDVSLTNEPVISNPLPLSIISFAFKKGDENPNVRPLYNIARLNLNAGDKAVIPKWMMIKLAETSQLKNSKVDFRDEVTSFTEPGELVFDIFVSDQTKDATQLNLWTRLGQIQVEQSVVSFGCDRRLSFSHPRFKDPN